MKWCEVRWRKVKWSEMKESEVKESELNLSEVKWSEDLQWQCVYFHGFIVLWLYAGSVQYVVSLLFASLCYFLITRLMFLILFLCLFSCFVFFYFGYSVFLYWFVYWFSFCIQLSLSYYCTSLPTTATGWKPSCSK